MFFASSPSSWFSRLRQQLPATLNLAFPLVLGQAAQMAMILIDMFMVGRLGPDCIGGVGLASAIFYVFTLFGAGVMYGLDPLVSQAFGRKKLDECNYWLVQSIYVSVLISLPSLVVLHLLASHLDMFGFAPELTRPAAQFLNMLNLSMPPFLIFIAFRQYLQATGSARPGSVVTGAAILFNIVFDLCFIFGTHWGAFHIAAMGVAGAGLATTLTRTLMALALVVYTLRRDARKRYGLTRAPRRLDRAGGRKLLAVGLPTGLQVTLEAAVFSLATALMSRVGVVAAASHTIALNISSFTYMMPVGIAGAAAVLVGGHIGAGENSRARDAGWTSISVAATFMATSGLLLVFGGTALSRLFTQDAGVIALTRQLLTLVAIYQVADGVQVVSAGALRGLGDTRSPMIATLLGYWAVGLPLGCWLCFARGGGALGMWWGLSTGVFAVAAFVLWRWIRTRAESHLAPHVWPQHEDAAVLKGCTAHA